MNVVQDRPLTLINICPFQFDYWLRRIGGHDVLNDFGERSARNDVANGIVVLNVVEG
jgi:hypothetical protein